MRIIYSDTHKLHNPRFEIYDGKKTPMPEIAKRAEGVIKELALRRLGQIQAPAAFNISNIYAVHSRQYVNFLRRSSNIDAGEDFYPSYFISDTYAPLTKGTFQASIQAVNCALTGANCLLNGETLVYSLCRPPGHHAEHSSMGGYCYFNNAAIAANFLSTHGRVAILDIDFHHGNGTQSAFYNRDDVLFVSLHADPKRRYPYTSGFTQENGVGQGYGYNINFPLKLSTSDEEYLQILESAIAEIRLFEPDFLVVSAGFDTFEGDPIGGLKLTLSVYPKIAAAISNLNCRTIIIQEGGYNTEQLPHMVADFLQSFQPG